MNEQEVEQELSTVATLFHEQMEKEGSRRRGGRRSLKYRDGNK